MAGSSAWARDDGDWQILQARYGTSSRNIDVTEQLREVARSDRRVRVTNELFGNDPAPRDMKTLRTTPATARRDPHLRVPRGQHHRRRRLHRLGPWGRGPRRLERRLGRRPRQRPHDDGAYQILGARYGLPGANIDVTDRLKQLARRDLKVQITNDLFRDDPAPRRLKTLRIYARGPRRRRADLRVPRGLVDRRQPVHRLGRGDWGDRNWKGPTGKGVRAARAPRLHRARDLWRQWSRHRRDGPAAQHQPRRPGGPRVDNDLFDRDPAEGRRKTLRVVYTVGRGQEQVAEAREGSRLSFP
ncbi:hypothetical protein Ddc_24748 [Ditylenchus destructor]|nr:hypothetical protein Ddc_24748 [Ditylenchus destructor]